jgi:hypothetical protein
MSFYPTRIAKIGFDFFIEKYYHCLFSQKDKFLVFRYVGLVGHLMWKTFLMSLINLLLNQKNTYNKYFENMRNINICFSFFEMLNMVID